MNGESQHNRLLRLEFPFKNGPQPAILLPNILHAHEELSRGFRFEVELLPDDARIPLKMMMGRMVTITLVRMAAAYLYAGRRARLCLKVKNQPPKKVSNYGNGVK